MAQKRLTLTGGVPQTSTSVFFTVSGDLCIELYDFSPAAQEHFGNDVAYAVIVPESAMGRVRGLLGVPRSSAENAAGGDVLDAIERRFSSYFDIKDWLKEQDLPFKTKFEARA